MVLRIFTRENLREREKHNNNRRAEEGRRFVVKYFHPSLKDFASSAHPWFNLHSKGLNVGVNILQLTLLHSSRLIEEEWVSYLSL
jgi:hypothetical protein